MTTNFQPGPWQESEGSIGIRLISCPDFNSFFEFVNRGFGDGDVEYLWRGQRNADWQLVSALARVDSDRPAKLLLSRFRAAVARCTHLEYELPTGGDELASDVALRLWSLGQHHGLLTPLLDWTVYPFVALFFAFAEPTGEEKERAVFALNWSDVGFANFAITNQLESFRKQLQNPPYSDQFKAYLKSQYGMNFRNHMRLIDASDLPFEIRRRLCGWERHNLDHQTLKMFAPRTNENPRIHSQGGRHIYTPDHMSVEQWIEGCVHKGHLAGLPLTKIRLPASERRAVLRALNKMNINFLNLFQDFEGAARHCNMAFLDDTPGLTQMRDY